MNDHPTTDVFTEARRKSISESLRVISVEELTDLGERLFPLADDPWAEKYSSLIAENAETTFYHATTHDHFQIVYCHAANKGIWFLPDFGKGRIQPKDLEMLKEIVESR